MPSGDDKNEKSTKAVNFGKVTTYEFDESDDDAGAPSGTKTTRVTTAGGGNTAGFTLPKDTVRLSLWFFYHLFF